MKLFVSLLLILALSADALSSNRKNYDRRRLNSAHLSSGMILDLPSAQVVHIHIA